MYNTCDENHVTMRLHICNHNPSNPHPKIKKKEDIVKINPQTVRKVNQNNLFNYLYR